MLKLLSNAVIPLSESFDSQPCVRRLVSRDAPVDSIFDFFLANKEGPIPSGFRGYFFFKKPTQTPPPNSFLLEPELSYLADGDVVRLNPKRNGLRTLYRKRSPHNFFLLTERCNNYCLMCSQPPKEIDDSYIVDDILQVIPLMSPDTVSVGLTGGEPSLLGPALIKIIESFKNHLSASSLHILSNGRGFDTAFAKGIAEGHHPDLMIGIPIYSDIAALHNHVVQGDGAFDETIRGIINLKRFGVKVEIRVVIHKLTYERLPDLARFIRRNLTFCDHVALMGLEITGFTKINLEQLWIDPVEYQDQLAEAVEILSQAGLSVSIYNHQLCLLKPSLIPFNVKSISDWKNEFMPECKACKRMNECGGFFNSAKIRYSSHIKPF